MGPSFGTTPRSLYGEPKLTHLMTALPEDMHNARLGDAIWSVSLSSLQLMTKPWRTGTHLTLASHM